MATCVERIGRDADLRMPFHRVPPHVAGDEHIRIVAELRLNSVQLQRMPGA